MIHKVKDRHFCLLQSPYKSNYHVSVTVNDNGLKKNDFLLRSLSEKLNHLFRERDIGIIIGRHLFIKRQCNN